MPEPNPESPDAGPAAWWGDYAFEAGATGQWQIGPHQLTVQRWPQEWLLRNAASDLTDDEMVGWSFAWMEENLKEMAPAEITRFVFAATGRELQLRPRLADRPVVVRPLTPFSLLPNQAAPIYVSTPLWLSLSVGRPGEELFETPLQRPTDTWFGPSTMDGEPCYASRTFGRLDPERLPHRPHRAVTRVEVDNRSPVLLTVARLNLPVPYLSLYATPAGHIWTESVTMVQRREGDLAEFEIRTEPPADDAMLIAPPRHPAPDNMLVRAFAAFRL